MSLEKKRRGRPTAGYEQLSVRLLPHEMKAVEQLAIEEERSISNMIRVLCLKGLKDLAAKEFS